MCCIPSEATMDTMIDVAVDEDCTSTVDKIPIIRPASGFVNTTLLLNASEAYLPFIF